MKIFIPKINWVGNWDSFFKNAFKKYSIDIASNSYSFMLNPVISALKLRQIRKIQSLELKKRLKSYNKHILDECVDSQPDVFLTMNGAKLYPTIIKEIKNKCNCLMVCILADDPWDSIRFKTDFPHSLKYFDIIYNGEPALNLHIKRVAPHAKVIWNYGGYDPKYFYPVAENEISDSDKQTYLCDLSFTGSSYGAKAEGAYRSDILSYIADYDLRIWGDDNWPYRFKYLPELKAKYKGSRLPYQELRKLYSLTKINLNLPAPQVITGIQPRVFEIAACKGFQIADHRSLLRVVFEEDELVTFKTIDDLREKIKYYLSNEKERMHVAEKIYHKVKEKYTWENWIKDVITVIQHPDKKHTYEDVHEWIENPFH